MNEKAVITGDLIASTRLSKDRKSIVLDKMNRIFKDFKKDKEIGVIRNFEIYRGDEFQGGISNPEQALRVALMIKCALKMSLTEEPSNIVMKYPNFQGAMPNARIAIGIGEAQVIRNKITISDGDAFQLSGRLLDSMKSSSKLMIMTSIDKLDQELDVYCGLLDVLIEKWSPYQSAYIFYKLKNLDITDKELAEKMHISQPALSQRRKTSGWDAVYKTVERFENIIANTF